VHASPSAGCYPWRWLLLLCIPLVGLAGCSRADPTAGSTTQANCTGNACNGYYVGSVSGQSSPEFKTVEDGISAGLKASGLPSNLTPPLASAPHDLQLPKQLNGCFLAPTQQTTSNSCIYPDKSGAPGMVLLGDSHAAMWSMALDDLAIKLGYNFLLLSKASCPPPEETFWLASHKTPNLWCNSWRLKAIQRINAFKPKIVIVTGNDFQPIASNGQDMPQSTYSAGLLTTLQAIAAPGRRVIVLGDISYLTQAGDLCLAAHENSVQTCTTATVTAAPASHLLAQEQAASKAGDLYINAIPWLCTPAKCPAVIGNYEVYEDQFHITTVYAVRLEPVLQAALKLT
jgi:hypothetical protein